MPNWKLFTEPSSISTKLIRSPFISYTFLCCFTPMYIQYLSFCHSIHFFDNIFVFLLFFTLVRMLCSRTRELFCVFKRCLCSFSPFLSRQDRVNKLFFIIVFILALCTILLLEFYHCCVDVDFLFGTCIKQIWYYDNERLRGPLRFKITLKSLWRLINVSPPSCLEHIYIV